MATQRLFPGLTAISLAFASPAIPAQTPPTRLMTVQVENAPVTGAQLYTAFLAVLKASGYTVEERDGTLFVGAKPW